MDEPKIVLGVDHGPDYDTIAVCSVDPDIGAVTLVAIHRIGHGEEPDVEVTEVSSGSGGVVMHTEVCYCIPGGTGGHPKGSRRCHYEENR